MIEYWPTLKEIKEFKYMPNAYLEAQASKSHKTSVFNIEVPTIAGLFGLGASAFGVTTVYFPGFDDFEIMDKTSKYGLAAAHWGEQRAIEAGIELMGYFVGEVTKFETPVDLSFMTPFQQDVLGALITVPYGETVSYAELAAMAGHAGKNVAVGSCLKHNPAPVIVPCHRVISASGAIGGWSGPKGTKEELLKLEKTTSVKSKSTVLRLVNT